MKRHEKDVKRGPDGKFLPGHVPPKSPGRPPGPNGIKARATQLASERLEQMLERATEIISDELNDGNPAMAQWLVDRVRPPSRSDSIRMDAIQKFQAVEDIILASEVATIAAARGEISLQQAKLFQELLAGHVQIKGFEELTKLRAEVDRMQSSSNRTAKVDMNLLPTWGRLGNDD